MEGHKETSLPDRPHALSKEPLSTTSADIVVIGGGVREFQLLILLLRQERL